MDLAAIWNMALAGIGSTATVTGPGDGSKAGVQCALWWPVARDLVLRAYPWPFATVTVELVQVPAATFQAPDWKYAFGYPADCLKALEILSPAGRNPPSGARIAWTVRAAPSGGRYVVSSCAPIGGAGDGDGACAGGVNPFFQTPTSPDAPPFPPVLRYITRVADPEAFPPEVAVAMAWQLAAYLAMPLAQAKELRGVAEGEAMRAIAAAVATNLNEGQRDRNRDADAQQARR